MSIDPGIAEMQAAARKIAAMTERGEFPSSIGAFVAARAAPMGDAPIPSGTSRATVLSRESTRPSASNSRLRRRLFRFTPDEDGLGEGERPALLAPAYPLVKKAPKE